MLASSPASSTYVEAPTLLKRKEPPIVSIQAKVAAASVAGLFGTLIIYPLDVLKTTLQVFHHHPSSTGDSKLYT